VRQKGERTFGTDRRGGATKLDRSVYNEESWIQGWIVGRGSGAGEKLYRGVWEVKVVSVFDGDFSPNQGGVVRGVNNIGGGQNWL